MLNLKFMMEKMGKLLEFLVVYKLKFGLFFKKKDVCFYRCFIEWKSFRGEEVDKRRNLKNLFLL